MVPPVVPKLICSGHNAYTPFPAILTFIGVITQSILSIITPFSIVGIRILICSTHPKQYKLLEFVCDTFVTWLYPNPVICQILYVVCAAVVV
jgi:hypothetical protein